MLFLFILNNLIDGSISLFLGLIFFRCFLVNHILVVKNTCLILLICDLRGWITWCFRRLWSLFSFRRTLLWLSFFWDFFMIFLCNFISGSGERLVFNSFWVVLNNLSRLLLSCLIFSFSLLLDRLILWSFAFLELGLFIFAYDSSSNLVLYFLFDSCGSFFLLFSGLCHLLNSSSISNTRNIHLRSLFCLILSCWGGFIVAFRSLSNLFSIIQGICSLLVQVLLVGSSLR